MSLDYDISKVDRDKWPDEGIHLYDFCIMMMLTGVPHLKTEADAERLKNRATIMSVLKDFGWKRFNKKEGQMDMIDIIPLMHGIRTNVSAYSRKQFLDRLNGIEW